MISTKGRYALRVMIDLAQHAGKGNVTLKSIADRQDISKKYLEIIVKDLVKGDLVKGVSGKGGGYSLSREADEYTVGEILELMEGSLAPVACLKDDAEPCSRAETCLTLPMWKEYYDMIRKFFYGKKLSDLLGTQDPVYYI
jgi:Rrf2 family iron-sulfur cluster assembly transcriptional regulator